MCFKPKRMQKYFQTLEFNRQSYQTNFESYLYEHYHRTGRCTDNIHIALK